MLYSILFSIHYIGFLLYILEIRHHISFLYNPVFNFQTALKNQNIAYYLSSKNSQTTSNTVYTLYIYQHLTIPSTAMNNNYAVYIVGFSTIRSAILFKSHFAIILYKNCAVKNSFGRSIILIRIFTGIYFISLVLITDLFYLIQIIGDKLSQH